MNLKPTLLPLLALVVCGLSLDCRAEEKPSISVMAKGEAEVKPDTLVLNGKLSESSEKMPDAVTAFNDTRRRALEALNAIELENISIKSSSLSIDIAGDTPQNNPWGGQVEVKPPGTLTLSQSITVTIKGIDKLEDKAVIDQVITLVKAAKEAGVEIGGMDAQAMMMMRMGYGGMPSEPAVMFQVSEPEAIKRAATKDAMEQARAEATFLAELSGGKLGKVLSIGQMPDANNNQMNYYAMMFSMMQGDAGEFGTNSLEPVKISRGLSVKFELIIE